jgi:hypothetical protein
MTQTTVERISTARLTCERLTLEHADELRPIMFEESALQWLAPGNVASRRVMEKSGFSYEREFVEAGEEVGLPHVLYRRRR